MYGVWYTEMRRTNIYVTTRQSDLLRRVAEQRGQPVAELVREAVDSWLASQGVQEIAADEWQRRFDALFERRGRIAAQERLSEADVDRTVLTAVREVRKRRRAAARRR